MATELSPINEAPAAGTANTCQYMPIFQQPRTRRRPKKTATYAPADPRQDKDVCRAAGTDTALPPRAGAEARRVDKTAGARAARSYRATDRFGLGRLRFYVRTQTARRHFPLVTFLALGDSGIFRFRPRSRPRFVVLRRPCVIFM